MRLYEGTDEMSKNRHSFPQGGHHRIEAHDDRPRGSLCVDAVLALAANGPVKSSGALGALVWRLRGNDGPKPAGWCTQPISRLTVKDDWLWVKRRTQGAFGDHQGTYGHASWDQQPLAAYADGSVGLSDYGEALASHLAMSRDLSLWEDA